MFVWLNKQGVRSERGFVVQFTGRFTAEYRELGKTVTLDVEDGLSGGLPCIAVNSDAFEHWDNEAARIPPAQQADMFRNLADAMKFQGLKLVIDHNIA